MKTKAKAGKTRKARDRVRILFFSDAHSKYTGPIPDWNRVDSSGMTEELRRFTNSMAFMRGLVEKRKPTLVVFLGDLYHSIYSIDVPTLVHTQRAWDELYDSVKKAGSELWAVRGNHDAHAADISAVEIVRCDRLFTAPEGVTVEFLKVGVVPYRDPENLMYVTIKDMMEDYDLIFTHCSFIGARRDAQHISDSGFSLGDVTRQVFNGHYHIPQELCGGLLQCVGSVYQNLPNEQSVYIPHGALEWNEDGKITRHTNTYVKRIAVVRGMPDGLGEPGSVFVKAIVDDSQYDSVKSFLEENRYEHMMVRVPKVDRSRRVIKFESASPQRMIVEYIKANYPHLQETVKEVTGYGV